MKRNIILLGLSGLLTLSCARQHISQAQQNPARENTGIIGGADVKTGISVADSLSLEQKGLALTRQMHRLASDEAYIKYCSHSEEINKQTDDIARTDFSAPKKIFAISHLDSIQNLVASGTSRTLLTNRLLRSIPSQINAQSGSAVLATSSLLTTEDVFLYRGLTESTLYLYIYEGDCCSMVLFQPYKDHIVQANASFVIHPLLKTIQSADDVKHFFKETIQLEGIKVKELTTTGNT